MISYCHNPFDTVFLFPVLTPIHPELSQVNGSKKSQKANSSGTAPASSSKPEASHHPPSATLALTDLFRHIQAKKTPTTKPSGHKPKKSDDVPVELLGVGAWCDDMPEQYEGQCSDDNLDL
ncbi:hypothetical protein PG994_007085 [Apiospora phragmitis]|uniref:Uncharacterized protein n=1 Tax=Apiospora phragmitis TaxID=2905665 RepID=A0ABR1V0J8_9PEZI